MSTSELEPIFHFYQAVQAILDFEQGVLNEWARKAVPRNLGKQRQDLLRNLRQLRGDALRAGVQTGETPGVITKLLNGILEGCQQLQSWDAKLVKEWPVLTGRRRGKAEPARLDLVESGCQNHSRLADALYPALSQLADLLLLKTPKDQSAKKWEFGAAAYRYQGGKWHKLSGIHLKLLKRFEAANANQLTTDDIIRMDGGWVSNPRVHARLSELRKALRRHFRLPAKSDPLPNVAKGVWQLDVLLTFGKSKG